MTPIPTATTTISPPPSKQVSSTEQDVVCQAPNLAAHFEAVQALVGSAGVEEGDKLRLVLLFALRYERDGRPQIMALMKQLQVRRGWVGGWVWGWGVWLVGVSVCVWMGGWVVVWGVGGAQFVAVLSRCVNSIPTSSAFPVQHLSAAPLSCCAAPLPC